jgi:hypothetical protein
MSLYRRSDMKLSDVKPLFEGENSAEIEQLLSSLDYKPTTKKKIVYKNTDDVTLETLDKMPRFSFAVAAEDFTLHTVTSDGKPETTREVPKGSIVFSGPNREKYYPDEKGIKKNWVIDGDTAYPEQNVRMVAQYDGKEMEFWPPWETPKPMPLLPGDYVVKEAEGKYYRIGKSEYEQTYNPPGKKG